MSVDVLTALCCQCGEPRFVKASYVGRSRERRLRCEHCRRTTLHAVVGAGDPDPVPQTTIAEAEARGLFVVAVPTLPDGVDAVWCPEARTMIARHGLSLSAIDRYVAKALDLAAAED